MRKANSTINITIAPICKTDANVLEERHRNAVEATRRSKITIIPTKVTIHMVLRFMMNDSMFLYCRELNDDSTSKVNNRERERERDTCNS